MVRSAGEFYRAIATSHEKSQGYQNGPFNLSSFVVLGWQTVAMKLQPQC